MIVGERERHATIEVDRIVQRKRAGIPIDSQSDTLLVVVRQHLLRSIVSIPIPHRLLVHREA